MKAQQKWRRGREVLTGLGFDVLNDAQSLRSVIEKGLSRYWETPVDCAGIHQFSPHGLSLVFVSSSCRVIVHSWPEHETVTLDVSAESRALELLQHCCHLLRQG